MSHSLLISFQLGDMGYSPYHSQIAPDECNVPDQIGVWTTPVETSYPKESLIVRVQRWVAEILEGPAGDSRGVILRLAARKE